MYRYLSVILLLLCQPVLAAGEKLPVWQLQGEGVDVVLLGSVHLAYPGIYPLRDEIEQAFAKADNLVVEVDVGGANALLIQEMMLEKGLLPAGENLSDHLSESVWASLEKYIRSRGLPLDGFMPLRPGIVVTMLSTMRLMEMGMRPELGIDQHFLNQARGSKPILELETAADQIDLLLSFPDPNLLMEQTLVQLDQVDLYMRPIYEAWKAGDAQALNRLLLEDELAREPRFQPIYEAMFDARNREMAAAVSSYLEGQGSYFVVVGAGHLVGEEGIIALLERRGYRARRL